MQAGCKQCNNLVFRITSRKGLFSKTIVYHRELFQVLAWAACSCSLQTDGCRTCLGICAALPHNDHIYSDLRNAKLPSDGSAPYALMVLAAMLPWQFFANAIFEASNSLIANANLIGKVYFPRLIVPTATVVVALIDFLISFVILVGMMIWYRFVPEWQIVLLPIFVGLAFFASLGPGLWIT
jgi:lipopolysaccharide transport system permease protein